MSFEFIGKTYRIVLYENVYLALQPHLLAGYSHFPLEMNYTHTKVEINDHK